jgi:hypothetical protein
MNAALAGPLLAEFTGTYAGIARARHRRSSPPSASAERSVPTSLRCCWSLPKAVAEMGLDAGRDLKAVFPSATRSPAGYSGS